MTTDAQPTIDLTEFVSKKVLWDLCERLRDENDWCTEVFRALYEMGITEDPNALLRTQRFPIGTVRGQVTTASDHFVYAKIVDNQWRMDRLRNYPTYTTDRPTHSRYISDLHVSQNNTFEIFTPDVPEIEKEEIPSTDPTDYVSKDIVRQVTLRYLRQRSAREADSVRAALATIDIEFPPRLRARDFPVHAGVLARKSGGYFGVALKTDENTWIYNTTRDYVTEISEGHCPTRSALTDDEVDTLGYLFVLHNPEPAPDGVWE